jgi:transcriptional regulator with XRE-family HTH domain
MNQPQKFGDWLKERMQAKGLTAAVLADMLDRSIGVIFRWRNGTHHPVGKTQSTLADALGVPVADIRMRVFKERRDRHAKGSTPVGAA